MRNIPQNSSNILIAELLKTIHQGGFPAIPEADRSWVAFSDKLLGIADKSIQCFVVAPTILHTTQGRTGKFLPHILVVAGGTMPDKEQVTLLVCARECDAK